MIRNRKIKKEESKISIDIKNLKDGQLVIAHDIAKRSFENDILTQKKIDEIFQTEEKRRKNITEVKAYRNECPNFGKNCMGDVDTKKSGCIACMKNKEFNVRNGRPVDGTKELQELEDNKKVALEKTMKKCHLNMDKDFCEYKGIFNYCALCEKEFKRGR